MSRSKPACERCGAVALVHITSEAASEISVRHLCLHCADLEESAPLTRDRYLHYGAIMMSVGSIILFLSLFADSLKFGNSEGFGPLQQLGLGMALICVFTAALIRVPTLMIIGVVGGLLTILADVFQFGHDPGFGWHQKLGALVGATLILTGWLESRRQS
jgi:hypothetical protein